jgi:hydrogenase maturation protein HypF
MTGRRIAVQGTVQGVGFRPWVYQLAHELHLRGSVKNGPDGVTIDAFADLPVLDELLARLRTGLPPAARIESLNWQPLDIEAPQDFAILGSDAAGTATARASIPADLAMCDACRAEIHDPTARRYEYAFTNCTCCGPRFSIATGVPYDRPRTTMVSFEMCAQCRAEYENPLDRRFHAQPIACPACGPTLSWLDALGGRTAVNDPLAHAAARLLTGHIVALRGLGGFHLACDAMDEEVVAELRRRKHRDEKPLAVMVPDLATALALAELGAAEVALLTSASRPIVLAPLRAASDLAPSVAPGFRQVGLFLPYTPMHELLLALVRRPLVMTSGNLSDEPMCVENDDAVKRLSGIADGFLVHDRPIATRTDDSVTRVVAGAPMVLRRARGYVPQSLPAPRPVRQSVLAVGGQLKNTFCIASGSQLTLGPHVGDLGDLGTYESFAAMAARLERFLEVEPQVLVHDLHPDYDTTRYAQQRPARARIGVQHHHAHVAAVMAEHQLKGPVIGVAFDGAGYGEDGTSWGGEFLLARYGTYERLATLRPIRLVGSERAIKEPWRLALAALDDAFDGQAPIGVLDLFNRVSERDVTNVRLLLDTGFQAVPAHGAGRVFDAAAALALSRPKAAFEAQLAMMLEQAAQGEAEPWPYHLDRSRAPHEVDLRPMWRAMAADLIAGSPPSTIAARLHATLAAASAETVRAIAQRHPGLKVVLAGGCFANAILTADLIHRLDGFEVFVPRCVPPGDGGLALGQAAVAAARLEGEP